ncbi:septum formation family protein [Streptomyces sp. NPDC096033]|uniref:septum formation family protein n=1 Tax=Streptomyces sp. NPDC096033 TaxID=3366071 RepID=UPI0037F659EA
MSRPSRPRRLFRARAAHGAALTFALFLGVSGAGAAHGAPAFEDTSDLEVGDCFNSGANLKDYETGKATKAPETVNVVSCDEVHQSEVFAVITLPEGSFPGEQKITSIAEKECADKALHDYAGPGAKIPDKMHVYYSYPTPGSWDSGERDITCFVSDPTRWTIGSIQADES